MPQSPMKPGPVVCGLDVGKRFHHAHAIGPDGAVLLSRRVDNAEEDLRVLYGELAAHGPLQVVVDQPHGIGALALAVAAACGARTAYIPPSAMRDFARLLPGAAKTDRIDARAIALAAAALPAAIRPVAAMGEDEADLKVYLSLRADLVADKVRLIGRIRALLTDAHPALEAAIGPRLSSPAMAGLLAELPGPGPLAQAGPGQVARVLKEHRGRRWTQWAREIAQALDSQSLAMPAARAIEAALGAHARSLQALLVQIAQADKEIAAIVAAHPMTPIVSSIPGFGATVTATVIAELAGRAFASAGHLASWAGVAPADRQSGTSIRSQGRNRHANRRLRNAFHHAAFTATRPGQPFRDRFEHLKSQGKHHNKALGAISNNLARILYALLRDNTTFNPDHHTTTPTQHALAA